MVPHAISRVSLRTWIGALLITYVAHSSQFKHLQAVYAKKGHMGVHAPSAQEHDEMRTE